MLKISLERSGTHIFRIVNATARCVTKAFIFHSIYCRYNSPKLISSEMLGRTPAHPHTHTHTPERSNSKGAFSL